MAERFQICGVVHLRPLPGAPRYDGHWPEVLDRARRDAEALVAGGVDGLVVENFGDAPFHPEQVPPETIAAMTRAVTCVRELVGEDLSLGVNVLRNDARAALAIASVGPADFVRVNVHQGAVVTDQGPIVGRAHETLRVRATLAPGVKIFADAAVKHAAPLAPRPLREEVEDLVQRGLADVVLITGPATGSAVDPRALAEAREAAGDVPVWIASGFDEASATSLVPRADGAIVGSSLERNGRAGEPVELERVRRLVEMVRTR